MIKTFIRRDEIFRRTLSVFFLREMGERRHFISKIEWTCLADGMVPNAEPIQLEPDEAQQLMDSLWDMGLRPSEGSGSAGALMATQKHLDDMRTLVFRDVHTDERDSNSPSASSTSPKSSAVPPTKEI